MFESVPATALKNTASVFHIHGEAARGKLTIEPSDRFREIRNSIGNVIRLREALRSQGVPDIWRGRWPVLCCDGKPLWVLGGARTLEAEPARPGSPALTVIVRFDVR